MSAFARVIGSGQRVGTDPSTVLFDRQRLAFNSRSRRVTLVCGRRSGKTILFLCKAASVMRSAPGCRVPYIALTRGSAENILWNEAVALNEKLRLGWTPNKTKLQFTAPNGAVLFLVGANKSDEVEKLRGQPFLLIGIDEAASFRPTLLRYLIDDVLKFALMDHDGALWVFGTPGAACTGFFHDISTGKIKGWDRFHWNALHNPHIPHARRWMEAEMQERGIVDWDHPTVQREFLGKWTLDLESLVYRVTPANLIDAMPNDYAISAPGWLHVFGQDYGVVNACVTAIWAHRTSSADKTAYLVRVLKESGVLPGAAAEHTADLAQQYRPIHIFGDPGGIGASYIGEANRIAGLHVEKADKLGKQGHIAWFNGALSARPESRIKIVQSACEPFLEEAQLLQWKLGKVEVKVGGVVRHEDRKQEDPRFENDACDGALYGWVGTNAQWNGAKPKPEPRDATRDRVDDEADRNDPRYAPPKPYWDVD